MQSNNCGMPMYVRGDSNFKYTITWLLWQLFPPFLKMAVVNTNVPISQTLRHLEQFYSRCWIVWWIAISNMLFVIFNNITIRAIFKDGVCQSPLCPYLRNTVFRFRYQKRQLRLKRCNLKGAFFENDMPEKS